MHLPVLVPLPANTSTLYTCVPASAQNYLYLGTTHYIFCTCALPESASLPLPGNTSTLYSTLVFPYLRTIICNLGTTHYIYILYLQRTVHLPVEISSPTDIGGTRGGTTSFQALWGWLHGSNRWKLKQMLMFWSQLTVI